MSKLYHALYSPGLAAAMSGLALIALLAAALDNTAIAFGTVKTESHPLMLYLYAGAVELGVIALGLAIAARARTGRTPWRLYVGVAVFVLASMLANYDSALAGLLQGERVTWQAVLALDPWTLAKAGALGAALPIMALFSIEALREVAGIEPELLDLANAREDSADQREPEPAEHIDLGGIKAGSGQLDALAVEASPAMLSFLIERDPSATVASLARSLGVSRPTVYAWAEEIGAERGINGWAVGAGI